MAVMEVVYQWYVCGGFIVIKMVMVVCACGLGGHRQHVIGRVEMVRCSRWSS